MVVNVRIPPTTEVVSLLRRNLVKIVQKKEIINALKFVEEN